MPIAITPAFQLEFTEFLNDPSNEQLLQWAADLFTLATEVHEMPEKPLEQRLVRRAIFQMAWYLKEDHENREAHMSGFNSERIGGYSYQVMARNINKGETTDVPAFDEAVAYFTQKLGIYTVGSEYIFHQPFPRDTMDTLVEEDAVAPTARTTQP